MQTKYKILINPGRCQYTVKAYTYSSVDLPIKKYTKSLS